MKLIVGLGNPGKEYKKTRHNIGFMCLDDYVFKCNNKFSKERKFLGEICKIGNTILLKPTTFMNNSGESIRLVKDYFNIDKEDILVIYDDLDLPLSMLRLREKGGSGGHNGVKSIISHLGTNEFKRVKFGIDKVDSSKTVKYVLGSFSKKESELVFNSIDIVSKIIADFIDDVEFTQIMNNYN